MKTVEFMLGEETKASNIYQLFIFNTFAWSNDTARLEVRSDLLPTKSLFTFSEAYLNNDKKNPGEYQHRKWVAGANFMTRKA